VEGKAGNFRVTLTKKPRYVLEDKCTGCGVCVENCPVQYPDPYNQNISKNKAIHIYYSQAIPLITYVDESCRYLKDKTCTICEAVCKNGAIDFSQQEERLEVKVGAIILAPGFEPYEPKLRQDYGIGKYANVITSMDYERLLASTGPYAGQVLRPSDMKHPSKIAWIQCVGSRQVNPEGANSYCSAVCCTYTQKQVILTKGHAAATECTIFHNDIRSFGKDFERYSKRAEDLPGVRFIRSYTSVLKEDRETGNIVLRYATTDAGVIEEEFDLVVLSVGMNPPVDFKELERKFGIALNAHGFCKTNPVNAMQSSRPGVYISGSFQGPVDIPESVVTASGAGSQCGELLNYRRGDLSIEKEYPTEKDVSGEAPRIGVFVCHCGTNISGVVNVPAAVEYALSLPNVVYAQEQLFACATNSAEEITQMIREKGLNRVIVAACSPRTLEPLFRGTLREAGLNQYYCEMANIREHCSWVHPREKEEATAKARDIIRMAVARVRHLEPLQDLDLQVDKKALVVGGGIAGMTCALSIAGQGHEVYLLEKEKELGGTARRIHDTLEGLDVQAYLHELIGKVYKHPLIHVYTDATVTAASGFVGNFKTGVKFGRRHAEIKHGATVIAVGADLYTPTEYLYGEDERVMTQLELDEQIAAANAKVINAASMVMIQCVGCRNEDRDYCSRICCNESVKNALRLKEKNPGMDIYILFRDMRTYGYYEDYYREAAEKEVRFIRYEQGRAPQVEAAEAEGRPVLRV
jgi:heterodisulfide reductase subunit A2